LTGLFTRPAARPARRPRAEARESFGQLEARSIAEFSSHFRIQFHDPELLRLALTHRSYLSVTGMGPRESNERLEFLGDSVLGLITSDFLYQKYPNEHEGQLTKTKSLLVSKAILSRRALAMGLGRFILLSHSEMESGGRRRASILCDAFESVLGAIYLDQGFEAARDFVVEYLLRGSSEIVADKRHRNYKSQLQEYVQSTFHTHPVYRIRSQAGPDHSKLFSVEVMVGRRVLGEGRGPNKKEAEQAAARDAMEQVSGPDERRGEERGSREPRRPRVEERERREARPQDAPVRVTTEPARVQAAPADEEWEGRRSRRGGRGRRRSRPEDAAVPPAITAATPSPLPPARREEVEPRPGIHEEDDIEEVGRPEGPPDDRFEGPFEAGSLSVPIGEPVDGDEPWDEEPSPSEPESEAGEWDAQVEAGPEPADEEAPPEPWDADDEIGEGPVQAPKPPEPAPQPTSPQFGRKRQRRR
jgi:ribonuclease III